MHQAASLARAEGKLPDAVEETVRGAHVARLDWRALLRRHMTDAAKSDYSWSAPNLRFIDGGLYLPSIRSEGIETLAVIVDTSGSLPADILAEFWAEVREIATEIQPKRVVVLQVDATVRDATEYCAFDLPEEIVVRGPGRHRLPARLRLARRTRHPSRRVPVLHGHGVLALPRLAARLSRPLAQLVGSAVPPQPRALGRAH